MAAPTGFEPVNVRVKVWYLTAWWRGNILGCSSVRTVKRLFRFAKGINNVYKDIVKNYILERYTRLELATFRVEVWRSTNWTNTAYCVVGRNRTYNTQPSGKVATNLHLSTTYNSIQLYLAINDHGILLVMFFQLPTTILVVLSTSNSSLWLWVAIIHKCGLSYGTRTHDLLNPNQAH